MTISYNKLSVRIRLDNLRHNYRLFAKHCERVIPIIKSDAYGHGLDQCWKALEKEGAETMGVGFVSEAVQLRDLGYEGRILALLGPVDDQDVAGLWSHEILAAIAHRGQLETVARAARTNGPLDICLKFNTGMRRLGFEMDDLDWLVVFLKDNPELRPVMVTSHLANADEPDMARTVEEQSGRFQTIVGRLMGEGWNVESNLANSAGSLGHAPCHYDSLRLGIAMYGGNPFYGNEWEKLGKDIRPVMEVSAPVLQVHPLRAGESISYGWTYTADRDQTVAIVGVGYADGYSRSLSNKGMMNIGGHRVPIRGRICMQMTAVDVSSLADKGVVLRPGDRAYLLGGPYPGKITPEDLAGWWGTITYEVFCLLGMNPRTYTEA